MKNQGFDVSLSARVIDLKDWKWSLGASAGHYKNELTSLPNGSFITELYGGNVLSQVGTAAGVFYGYKTDGVFPQRKRLMPQLYTRLTKLGRRPISGQET